MGDKNKPLIFIDDSGDPGINPSASSIFVMACVVFRNNDDALKVNKLLYEIKDGLNWSQTSEFKFRKTNKKIILEILKRISIYNFSIYAVYLNKNEYLNYPDIFNYRAIYNYAIIQLLKMVGLENSAVRIDGKAPRNHEKKMLTKIRKAVNVDIRIISDIKLKDSKKDNLIQLADIVAGSVNRSIQNDKSDSNDYLEIVKDKIIKIDSLTLKDL